MASAQETRFQTAARDAGLSGKSRSDSFPFPDAGSLKIIAGSVLATIVIGFGAQASGRIPKPIDDSHIVAPPTRTPNPDRTPFPSPSPAQRLVYEACFEVPERMTVFDAVKRIQGAVTTPAAVEIYNAGEANPNRSFIFSEQHFFAAPVNPGDKVCKRSLFLPTAVRPR